MIRMGIASSFSYRMKIIEQSEWIISSPYIFLRKLIASLVH